MSQTQSNKPNGGSPPSMPGWVKVLIIIFVLLIALVVVMHLAGVDFAGHHMSFWLQQV